MVLAIARVGESEGGWERAPGVCTYFIISISFTFLVRNGDMKIWQLAPKTVIDAPVQEF